MAVEDLETSDTHNYMAEFKPTYLDPREFIQAPGPNVLDSILGGIQQGIALRRLPKTLQRKDLEDQLNLAILQQKVKDLQDPDQAVARKIKAQLALKGALSPETGIITAPTGLGSETIATPNAVGVTAEELAASGGPAPTAAPGSPETPIMIGNAPTGFSVSPERRQKELDDIIRERVAIAKATAEARPASLRTVVADIPGTDKQGLFTFNPRDGSYTPATMGGEDQISKTKPAAPTKVKTFTDAQGNLFQQPVTGGPATPVLDDNGKPINMGVANRIFAGDQGVFTVPSKTVNGEAPVASPLNANMPQAPVLPRDKVDEDIEKDVNIQLTKTKPSSNPAQKLTVNEAKALEGLASSKNAVSRAISIYDDLDKKGLVGPAKGRLQTGLSLAGFGNENFVNAQDQIKTLLYQTARNLHGVGVIRGQDLQAAAEFSPRLDVQRGQFVGSVKGLARNYLDSIDGFLAIKGEALTDKQKNILLDMRKDLEKVAGGAPEGKIRVVGPNGQTGTVPANSPLPPGWKTQQ